MSIIYTALAALGGLVVSLLIYMAVTILGKLYRARGVARKFKENSYGIPIEEDGSIIGGRVYDFLILKGNVQRLDANFKQHGDFFAFMKDETVVVATKNLDFLKKVLLEEPQEIDRATVPKFPLDMTDNSLKQHKGEQWRRVRRIVAPAVTGARIKTPKVQGDIQANLDKLISSIESRLDRAKLERGENFIVVDPDDMCSRFATGVAFSSFFNQDNKVDYESDTDEYVELQREGLDGIYLLLSSYIIMFPLLVRILDKILTSHRTAKFNEALIDFIKTQTKRKLEAKKEMAGASTKDNGKIILKDGSEFKASLIDPIIDKFHEGQLTKDEYIGNACFLFTASNATSLDTIARFFDHLARHQDYQERLREDIAKYGRESKYLTWCINETLRLNPGSYAGGCRTTTRDHIGDGFKIPAGTEIGTSVYTIHRMEKYWGPEPDEFRPERWRDLKNLHPAQFLPFGIGIRSCPGKEFFMLETRYLAEALFCRYKFDTLPGKDGDLEFSALMLVFNINFGKSSIRVSRL